MVDPGKKYKVFFMVFCAIIFAYFINSILLYSIIREFVFICIKVGGLLILSTVILWGLKHYEKQAQNLDLQVEDVAPEILRLFFIPQTRLYLRGA